MVIMAIKHEGLNRSSILHTANIRLGLEEEVPKTPEGIIELVRNVALASGYHPAGYGMYSPTMSDKGSGLITVTWKSSASCD